MAQDSDLTDLQTDAYPSTQTKAPVKAGEDIKQNQKKMLGISAAALLLGGSAWALKQDTTGRPGNNNGPATRTDDLNEPTIELLREIDVAGKVTDEMSFDQAFAAARQEVGMAGVFGWHGRWYNTFLKEEWNELSVQQRLDFTEMVTHEELPVKLYELNSTKTSEGVSPGTNDNVEPTIIEGHLNGQRVMGLDFNRDGVIDTLVVEGQDGYNYRVVDTTGNDGLDTLFRYDSLNGELVEVEKIEHPFVLSNDEFSQDLEESMSRDVVDSILESDTSTSVTPTHMTSDDAELDTEPDDDTIYLTDTHGADDDTYINNGNVHDMDE